MENLEKPISLMTARGTMIKEKFEPERGKTAGFYLLDGSFPHISASNPPSPKFCPEKELKAISNDDIKSVKAAIV